MPALPAKDGLILSRKSVLLFPASPTFSFHRPDVLGPRVVEVERERNPPDEVVRQAEDEGRRRPCTAVDELGEADDHAEAGENLRVVLQGQAREAEEPLRVERRVEPPRDVINPRRAEDRAV